jgi:capsule polysaccharide export protein KpsC/LpsZ
LAGGIIIMRKRYIIVAALVPLALCISGCPMCATTGARVEVINKAQTDVKNVNILFVEDAFKNKLHVGEKFTTMVTWVVNDKEAYKSDKHIEYLLNGKKYNSNDEQGAFAGKPLVINMGESLFITIYDNYYTMETKIVPIEYFEE